MASNPTHWLEDHIAIQLDLCRSWLKQKATQKSQGHKSALDRAWADLYDDNGSCVDIIDAIDVGQDSTLRIIQNPPLVLTDGKAAIEAKVTPDCIQDLYTRFGRQLLQAPPGNSVSIRKHTLRYTPYGPPRERLSLILRTIDWQGENLGPAESAALTPIASCDKVRDALNDLQQARQEEDTKCFRSIAHLEDEAMAPFAELEGNGGQQGSSSTQVAFGTQLVHPFRARPDDEIQFLGTHRLEPVLAGYTRREELRAETTKTDAAKQTALLNLLNKGPQKAPSVGACTRPSPSGPPRDVSEAGPAPNSTPSAALHVNHHVAVEGTRPMPLPAAPNVVPPAVVEKSERHIPEAEAEAETNDQTFDEHAQELGNSSSPQPDSVDLGDPVPEWLQGFPLHRLSAKVPSRQRRLLLLQECWQKPPPGLRFPEGNIPIEILEALKEHAERDFEASQPISSAELPHAGGAVNSDDADIGMEADSPTSIISWSRSPTPEPLKRPTRLDTGLPPDSSFEHAVDKIGDLGALHHQASNHGPQQPMVVESSTEQMVTEPPSSPPSVPGNGDSDEDMELDVPRGLGEDRESIEDGSASNFARLPSVVQVKETPYVKGKNGNSIPSKGSPAMEQQQESSGSSKDTSSTSIIRATYSEPNSSGEDHAAEAVAAEDFPPSPSIQAKEQEPLTKSSTDSHSRAGLLSPSPERVQPPYIGINDMSIDDVAFNSPQASHLYDTHSQNLLDGAAYKKSLLQPDHSPISAQMPPSKLSSSAGQVSPSTELSKQGQSTLIEPITAKENELDAAQSKRKFENSPSKKVGRQPKRREIKIVDFGDESPARNTAANLRKSKKESLERFRQERRSNSAASPIGAAKGRPLVSYHADIEAKAGLLTERMREISERPKLSQPDVEGLRNGDSRNNGSRQPMEGSTSNNPRIVTGPSSSIQPKEHALPDVMDVDSPPTSRAPPSTSPQQLSQPATIYQKFKAAYPEYTGNTQHFVGQCKQMYKLDLEDKMVPKWQWDDYMIRNRTSYTDYAIQCMNNGEDPEPYYRFYKDSIRDTLFKKGIIESRKTLLAAIEEMGEQPPPALQDSEPTRKPSKRSLPWALNTPTEPTPDRNKSPVPSRLRNPLPESSRQGAASPTVGLGTHRGALLKPPAPTTSSTSKSNPRRSFDGSAFNAIGSASRIPSEPTGDPYRDFTFGFQRATSFTGSTLIDPGKMWPEMLAVRQPAQVPRKGYDVLSWKDEL